MFWVSIDFEMFWASAKSKTTLEHRFFFVQKKKMAGDHSVDTDKTTETPKFKRHESPSKNSEFIARSP